MASRININMMLSSLESLPKNTLSRIAIDTVFFNMSYSGITRVWETILKNINIFASMNENIPNYEIILLIRGKNIPNSLQNIINQKKNKDNNANDKQYQLLELPDFNYITMMQDVDHLNYICKQNNINYFLSTYYTYSTIIPNILIIHDMIPEIFNMAPTHMWQQKDLAIKNASQFIVISNITKNDLIKYYPHIKTEKYPVSLIYNSVPSQNMVSQSTNPPAVKYDDTFLNNILINNGIYPKKYIFAITTSNQKYKNIQLIQNLSTKYHIQLCQKLNTQIPIIFLIKQQLPNGYAISNGMFYISNISDEILNTLYKNALCYINSSLYEGFGLPVFEAFSHRIPVIAINLPIYQELAPNAINLIENDVDELFDKICFIHKNINTTGHIVSKRIENGFLLLEKYSLEHQIQSIHTLFNSLALNIDTLVDINCKFLNIIFQSYDETNPECQKELIYCMQANLDNPYVKHIHDFGYQPEKYLPDVITKHSKYISIQSIQSIGNKKLTDTWLTYETAFNYSNLPENIAKYGSYWGIINCDIFLEYQQSQWQLIRGRLNSSFIFAQSRHEFNILPNGETMAKMDDNFAKLYHANTQDGWFYKAPIQITFTVNVNFDFQLGMLGCDNAIADRLSKVGYKVINQPDTFKIMHYDIAKGKNSSNYLEKHLIEAHAKNNTKPKNKHPERKGSLLVPNYDQLLGNNVNIDLNSIVNEMGGLSNDEKYKIISEIYSSRIIITNPD